MALFLRRIKIFNVRSTLAACAQAQPCPKSFLHTQSRPRYATLPFSLPARSSSALPHLRPMLLPTAARFNSTAVSPSAAAAASVSAGPDGYIPPPPVAPPPGTTSVLGDDTPLTPVLNALGEPTFVSQGLCNYTPAGALQWLMENIHVVGDLPWWGTIAVTTLCIRLVMFPLVIASQKNAAKMSNHMPTIQKLQNKFSDKRVSGDMFGAARVQAEMTDYMKKNKVNPMKSYMMPFIQMPIFVSVFVGLRAMATLPVESMSRGGILWFVDLTVPDPYYVLPLLTSATMLLTIEVGTDGMKAQSMSPGVKLLLRAMPVFMLPFVCSFPTAMLCYWMTSNLFSLMQVSFLRVPAVREFFNIPKMVDHTTADKRTRKAENKKGMVQGFKEFYSNSKLMADMENRRQADARMFEAAGKQPRQKTYKTNPKAIATDKAKEISGGRKQAL